jgi:hypothetical protein
MRQPQAKAAASRRLGRLTTRVSSRMERSSASRLVGGTTPYSRADRPSYTPRTGLSDELLLERAATLAPLIADFRPLGACSYHTQGHMYPRY